jgi:hypothetical protein
MANVPRGRAIGGTEMHSGRGTGAAPRTPSRTRGGESSGCEKRGDHVHPVTLD